VWITIEATNDYYFTLTLTLTLSVNNNSDELYGY
jgi:hypothetical protein